MTKKNKVHSMDTSNLMEKDKGVQKAIQFYSLIQFNETLIFLL